MGFAGRQVRVKLPAVVCVSMQLLSLSSALTMAGPFPCWCLPHRGMNPSRTGSGYSRKTSQLRQLRQFVAGRQPSCRAAAADAGPACKLVAASGELGSATTMASETATTPDTLRARVWANCFS
jgi:hypothetical protein